MATLPIGFFMPLPLPIMIPFMMWQSAAIAAGFGTYFQYSKRRISAMSNDEFNASNPSDLTNELFDNIMQQVPSSFQRVRAMNTLILQSMADFLEDGIKFLSGKLGGSFGGGGNVPSGGDPNTFFGLTPEQISGLPGADAEPFNKDNTFQDPSNVFPPAPPPTQEALLAKYANWETYRSKGGLLQIGPWKLARRGLAGGLPELSIPQGPTQGKIKHPAYVRTLQKLLDNKTRITLQLDQYQKDILAANKFLKQIRAKGGQLSAPLANIQRLAKLITAWARSLKKVNEDMRNFIEKFKP